MHLTSAQIHQNKVKRAQGDLEWARQTKNKAVEARALRRLKLLERIKP